MTEFNNLDIEIENNNTGEESEISSPEGVLQENFDSENKETNNLKREETVKEQSADPFLNKIFDVDLYVEKNKIKTDARTIGASFLMMYVVITVLNLMVTIIGTIFAMSKNYKVIEIINSPATMQVMQIFFALIAFTFPFVFIFKCSSIRISDIVSFAPPKKKHIIPFLLFGVSFCSFANIVSSIAASLFEKTNINYDVTEPENPNGFFGFMLVFISTVIVPALAEEFTCRGLILGLLKKYGDGFAIIVSSLLFGVMHGNFEQMPFAFLVGLVLGFITVKSGSILIAVAVHAFNNFVSVSFD